MYALLVDDTEFRAFRRAVGMYVAAPTDTRGKSGAPARKKTRAADSPLGDDETAIAVWKDLQRVDVREARRVGLGRVTAVRSEPNAAVKCFSFGTIFQPPMIAV